MYALEDNRGSPDRLSSVGIEGPKISVSRIPERSPRRAYARARFTAMVDFPTPPLAEETAITFLTSLILRRSGRPRCMRGMEPVRGNPFGEALA